MNMSEIQDFWALDQSLMQKDKIKEKCREYYTEDFINNYSKWKSNVQHINEDVKVGLTGIVPLDQYIDISFDHFCSRILELLEEHIELKGRIDGSDIMPLCRKLIEEHCNKLIVDWTRKKNSIDAIIQNIKKIVIR